MNEVVARRVVVKEIVSSRYGAGERPTSWDQRRPGLETVVIDDGSSIFLASNGGQSSPAPGWELLLQKLVIVEDPNQEESASPLEAFQWTLYGIAKES